MFALREDLMQKVRSMAISGCRPSEIVRAVIAGHPIEPFDRVWLARYFREAFCFWETGTSALYGWNPDGSGELDDAKLDELMARRIAKTRPEWEAALRASAA